jgi:hypothetical protein
MLGELKRFATVSLLCALTAVLGGCEREEFLGSNDDEYQLLTLVDAGVIGVPGTGTTHHVDGTVVSYNFSLADGFVNLAVFLDGEAVAPLG